MLMPRPLQPLISRKGAVEATIEIIDAEGLESFSLPRLARHLNVRAPSLYHHFEDKDELMTEVSRTIIQETPIPRVREGDPWQDWCVTLCMNVRRVILRHRNAAPVIMRFLPRDTLTALYDRSSAYFTESGVPESLHVLIMDGLDKLALGGTAAEAMREPTKRGKLFPNVEAIEHPALFRAVKANARTANRVFEETIRSFLRGLPAA